MSRSGVKSSQYGAALMAVMIWLLIVTLLSVSAARLALQDRKALQDIRDRVTAFQAAEAALLDGESDLDGSVPGNASRHSVFRSRRKGAMLSPDGGSCNSGVGNITQGFCDTAIGAGPPVWLTIDLADRSDTTAVRYGRFTGQSMQTGNGALPARLPRYLIEAISQQPVTGSDNAYRITAIGFGAREDNQVVLQSVFRQHAPGGAGVPAAPVGTVLRTGRLSWREISNWSELRQQLLHGGSRP